MARKAGLGKGLDALIQGGQPSGTEGGGVFVQISQIVPNPHQPRHTMQPDELQDLVSSIREHGILQPLIVSKDPQSDQYTLIAGERRMRAAQLAGLESVPVILRQATAQQMLELALIENVQRADLTPLETAEAYHQLHEAFSLSHEEIANRVGKSRVSVSNTLRLLNLPEFVRKSLAEGRISEGHARALLGLPTPQAQVAALQTVIRREMNVRQTEELVRQMCGEKPVRPAMPAKSPDLLDLEERLRRRLSTKVTLRHGKKGGSITLHYYSEEELETLIAQLLGE